MGSTGVQGAGLGSATNKGSEHMTLGVDHLIGPRVVAAGTEVLSGTTAVVEIPAPATAVTGYFVMLQAHSATYAYPSVALAAVADTDSWRFTITAGSGATVDWCLVKAGL